MINLGCVEQKRNFIHQNIERIHEEAKSFMNKRVNDVICDDLIEEA